MKNERRKIDNQLSILAEMASDDNENLMPYIIEAVAAKVTVGEICNTFRKVWGEYRPKEILWWSSNFIYGLFNSQRLGEARLVLVKLGDCGSLVPGSTPGPRPIFYTPEL